MTGYTLAQVALLSAAIATGVRQWWALARHAAEVDGRRYLRLARVAIARRDLVALATLAERAGDAWVAALTFDALEAITEGTDVGARLDERMIEIRFDAGRGLRSLRVLASLASASGLMGAVGAYLWMLSGDHGLAGLQAGLPMRIATGWGITSVSVGFLAMLLMMSIRNRIAVLASGLRRDCRHLAEALERLD